MSMAAARPRRVCIAVDHPQRDLEGMILVAMQLAARGAEAFLVPTFHMNEAFLLRPDLLVLNYARPNNRPLIETAVPNGIGVAILDTEGGVIPDVGKFAEGADRYAREAVLYCTWGEAQLRGLQTLKPPLPAATVATGSPRYDFACPRWFDAVPEPVARKTPFVLVNMNFPTVNPRFQSLEQEVEQYRRAGRYSTAEFDDAIAQLKLSQSLLIQATDTLAARLPHVHFVVRPHPFERRETYDERFAGRPNIEVELEGNVVNWIKRSIAVLHNNCSTAVEAILMGREPIHLAWFPVPLLEQPSSIAISRQPVSLEATIHMIETLAAGRSLPVDAALEAQRRTVIADWFVANDGNSAGRVADEVLRVIETRAATTTRDSAAAYSRGLMRAQSGWRRKLQWLAFRGLAAALYLRLRGRFGHGAIRPGKRFGVAEVEQVIARGRRADPALTHVRCAPAGPADRVVSAVTTGFAIRVWQAAA